MSAMKNAFLLLIVIVLINCSSAGAQGLHLGIKAGTDLSEVTGYSIQSGLKGGFMAGAFAEVNLIILGIQPEVLYSQINTQGADNQSIKLQYLNIPILLTIKLPIPIISLLVGPQFSTLLNKNDNLATNGKNAFTSGDFSMVAGAQLNLLKFKGGIRYVYGFSDINNTSSSESWKTRTVQIYIGLRIF
jgi:Outer membrane protein beta-barrel domain